MNSPTPYGTITVCIKLRSWRADENRHALESNPGKAPDTRGPRDSSQPARPDALHAQGTKIRSGSYTEIPPLDLQILSNLSDFTDIEQAVLMLTAGLNLSSAFIDLQINPKAFPEWIDLLFNGHTVTTQQLLERNTDSLGDLKFKPLRSRLLRSQLASLDEEKQK